MPQPYDDGGLSGASLERPALQLLLTEVKEGRVDVIVVYKVDRLTRSLADFAKLVETFDNHEVSFVSVTQSFNTTSSMGRFQFKQGKQAILLRQEQASVRHCAADLEHWPLVEFKSTRTSQT